MNPILLTVLLALGWVAITGGFSLPNLLLGAVLAAAMLYLLRDRFAQAMNLGRAWRVLALALLFVKELLLSALSVARLVLMPGRLASHLKPAIIAFPLTAKSDAEITLLANLITLTPGTLSLDVSADRQRLYIHVLSLGDREKLIADISRGLERKVMDVFR